ncbi:MAG: NnrS family protein, partial [Rhizobiales bacterium]|nr:NnrS family protein [Hyphomicrobiales bacterium]
VMTRASLGHTGRRIIAPRPIVWSYGLVTLAALLRVGAPFLNAELYEPALMIAALSWIGAFAIFVFVYAPILTTQRVHTKFDRP